MVLCMQRLDLVVGMPPAGPRVGRAETHICFGEAALLPGLYGSIMSLTGSAEQAGGPTTWWLLVISPPILNCTA